MNVQTDINRDVFDVCGVGIGPSNLSLAALLLNKAPEVRFSFFERRPEVRWHSGMLFSDADLQTSFLKDLVTLADPANPYSFLCFLAEHDRLYRFITARFGSIKRKEFDQYLRWVSQSLPHLNFNQPVERVEFDDINQTFVVYTSGQEVIAKNLTLGTGLSPKVPDCARPYQGAEVFHAIHYLNQNVDLRGKRVAVVGGGQSGAEIFSQALSHSDALPEHVYWISSRSNFLPIDDSPFVNEYFIPRYSNYFYQLPQEEKRQFVADQTLASDGITESLLRSIYQRLYQLEFLEQRPGLATLLPESRLSELERGNGAWRLLVQGHHGTLALDADVIVLATGFEYQMPQYLEPLRDRLSWTDGYPVLNADFSCQWDGPAENRIYLQNAARMQRGVADPNLSLMAWRSAAIVNSLAGRMVYKRSEHDGTIDWELSARESVESACTTPQNTEKHHHDLVTKLPV